MKRFNVLSIILLAAVLSVSFSACDSTSDPASPSDADVAAPTNIKASSADGQVILAWTASSSETQSNFGKYMIVVMNTTTNLIDTLYAAKGSAENIIGNLTNGTRYQFTVRSLTSAGKASSDYARIEWAPAVRQDQDKDGYIITVYATTSTANNSAVDFYNSAGKAEVLAQSGAEFKARGDAYVYAADAAALALSIKSPDQANNKGLTTQFSTVSAYNADNLDDSQLTAMPSPTTFTATSIDIATGTSSTGKIYFGRTVRGSDFYYFRILVMKDASGKLVQGTGTERFLEMEVSYQTKPNIPFAKKK